MAQKFVLGLTVTSVPPIILVRVSPQEQEERGQQGEVDELGKNLSWQSEISLSAIWTSGPLIKNLSAPHLPNFTLLMSRRKRDERGRMVN